MRKSSKESRENIGNLELSTGWQHLNLGGPIEREGVSFCRWVIVFNPGVTPMLFWGNPSLQTVVKICSSEDELTRFCILLDQGHCIRTGTSQPTGSISLKTGAEMLGSSEPPSSLSFLTAAHKELLIEWNLGKLICSKCHWSKSKSKVWWLINHLICCK